MRRGKSSALSIHPVYIPLAQKALVLLDRNNTAMILVQLRVYYKCWRERWVAKICFQKPDIQKTQWWVLNKMQIMSEWNPVWNFAEHNRVLCTVLIPRWVARKRACTNHDETKETERLTVAQKPPHPDYCMICSQCAPQTTSDVNLRRARFWRGNLAQAHMSWRLLASRIISFAVNPPLTCLLSSRFTKSSSRLSMQRRHLSFTGASKTFLHVLLEKSSTHG